MSQFRHLKSDTDTEFSVIMKNENVNYPNNIPQTQNYVDNFYQFLTVADINDNLALGNNALKGDILTQATIKDYFNIAHKLKIKKLIYNKKTKQLVKI